MYTVKNDKSYQNVLLKDGNECICPFQNALAIPTQNSLGQMAIQITRLPCSTVCPFAELIDEFIVESNTWEKTYVTKCTGTNVDFDIEQHQEPTEPTKIINLQ